MSSANTARAESLHHWIVVRPEPAGQFTAQLLGLPQLHATAASREQAIEQVRARIAEWIAAGQLVPIEVPMGHPLLRFSGWIDPNDPGEQVYLEELARQRAEDLERTLREYAQEDEQCSGSSSTPTT
jgi:HPt (histidine-containing phosphotransfer) domain-containing protein